VNEPTGFFHNFDQNVPTMCLSHSLRVLSKNAHKYAHNVPVGSFQRTHNKLSMWFNLPQTLKELIGYMVEYIEIK